MKKRILAMLLGLTLLLGCLPAGALAASVVIGGGGMSMSYSIGGPDDADDLGISKVGQVIEKLNNPPQGMATINDRLYAGCWDGLYVQVENGWKMLLGTEKLNNLSSIFAHDGALYLVAQTNTWADEEPTSSLTLYRLTETEEAADVEAVLENIPLGLDDDWPNFSSMFMDNDSLYMLYMNYGGRTGNDYGNNILLKVSLVDGSVSRVFQDYVQAVSPDGKGKLAGIYWKQEAAYREEDVIKPNLVSIDPVSGEITHHGSLLSPNVGALTLDAAAGCLYLVDDNKLYRYDDVTSAGVLCAYLPPNGSYSNNTGSAVMNGFFYIGTYSNNDDHFVSCSVDPSLLPNRKLRLASGAVEYELINAFCKAHPEIAIESVDAWFNSAEEMSQFMVSGDDSADVLYLSASSPIFPALRGKGYLADLSGSDVLAQFMSSVYPHMIQSLYQNDKLIAYPDNISSSTFGYYPAALEKVGLTEEDLPKSLMGLMDFAEMWHNDYAEEYPDIHLFSDAYSLYEQLFSMILEYQVVACDAKGEQVTFNTPTIRALLTRLEQLKPILDDMSMKPDADGSYSYSGPFNNDGEPGAMFSTYTNLLPERYGRSAWDGTPLLLSLEDGDEPYVPLNMSLLIVNPNSPNKDLAITYLEFLAQNRHQAEKVALMPEENTTLESEYYQENKKSIEDTIARVQRALESAPEESKENYKDQLEWLNLELEDIEEQRFAISEEDIADYRAIAPHLTVMTTNVFSESEDIQSITKRYLDGQMSAEQFIREFDRIVTMMLMENY